MPFAVVLYLTVAFIIYSTWCDIRGVDPGIGDYWQAPLSNGYEFIMVDITEEASIEEPNGNQVISRITSIGQYKNLLFGGSRDKGPYFILDSSSKQTWFLKSEQLLRNQCDDLGVSELRLSPNDTFYFRHRGVALDGVALITLIAIPVIGTKLWRHRRVRGGG